MSSSDEDAIQKELSIAQCQSDVNLCCRAPVIVSLKWEILHNLMSSVDGEGAA